jgi:hypothetical protein
MRFLLKFLPGDMRDLIELGQRVSSCLDTKEERREAVGYGIGMFADGKVTIGEWSRFGSKLGILKGPRLGSKRTPVA